MSLRREIVKFIHENPNGRYTNYDLAYHFNAPEASVRRATRQARELGELQDAGSPDYNPNAVVYAAPTA